MASPAMFISKRCLSSVLKPSYITSFRNEQTVLLSRTLVYYGTSSTSVPFLYEAGFINGNLAQASDGANFSVVNPADDKPIGTVPDMGVKETNLAIDAANNAFASWREIPAKERSHLLKNWFNLLVKNSEELAQLMTLEQGKPLNESRGELAYSNSFIEWFAEEGRRIYGDIVPSPFPSKRLLHFKQPVGVCGLITPWNFPASMITRKAGIAELT
jgi:succinate-semialdehyde dehydrogenase/glutarate-semialdehyde dehydrogenase